MTFQSIEIVEVYGRTVRVSLELDKNESLSLLSTYTNENNL